jgi:hypothetical protein
VAENEDAPKAGSEAASKKLEIDRAACQSEAKQKGFGSILAIIKSANRANTDKDYIACMKRKGYAVEDGSETTAGKAAEGASQAPVAKQ